MTDSRESRAHAAELKFLVDPDTAAGIRRWAREHMVADPHGAGPFGDQYETTSLYFDTDTLDVYHRRGSFGRAKYRIRRYTGTDLAFLERKLRRPRMVVKRRTRTTLDSLTALERAEIDPAWSGSWFHRRVLARRLRPACQLWYRRMARTAVVEGVRARLTLDGRLSGVPIERPAFVCGEGEPVLDLQLVLELKYTGAFPPIFRRLVEDFRLRPRAVSKYRLGMTVLGLADAQDEAPVLAEGDDRA